MTATEASSPPNGESPQGSGRRRLSKDASGNLTLLAITVLVALGFEVLEPSFLTLDGLLDIGRQTAVISIIAFAMTAVIIARGIDLSVGGVLAASGMIAAKALEAGLPPIVALAIAILSGAVLGLLNGILIGYSKISPFVVTLGVMMLTQGLTLSISHSSSVLIDSELITWWGSASLGPIPVSVLVALACLIGWILLLGRTVLGRWIYAVGGNAGAAAASLIPVRRVQMLTYVMAGAAAGLGAILTIGRVGSAQPLAGTGLEFSVITAAIIGGTKLSGGVGSVVGTFIGSILLGVVAAGLSFLRVPQETIYLITGLLVLIAVLASQRAEFLAWLRRTLRQTRNRSAATSTASAETAEPTAEHDGDHELKLEEIGKSFPGVRALDGISFTLRSGEVIALIGENGAGKSTLVKALAGVQLPDDGRMLLDGRPITLRSAKDAAAAGISVIHQHFSLVPDLTVAENLFLGSELRRGPIVRRREMTRRSQQIIDELGLDIRPGAPMEILTVGQRQMVEIAKAMLSDSWLVIMDEPTSALSNRERDTLYELVRRLTDRGVGVLYISHKMEEIFTLADRVVVMRDGRYVDQRAADEVTESELIAMMVGREVSNVFPHVDAAVGDVVLTITDIADDDLLQNATLEVRAGEVVTLAGLMGSGRSEVMRCVAGLDRHVSGEIEIGGEVLRPGDAQAANKAGVAYVPEDRHLEGFVPTMSVADNVALAWLRSHGPLGIVRPRQIAALAKLEIDRLGVRPADPLAVAGTLSGGNQQKVVIGKWLATEPRLLLLDEPTRGVDVGAKSEIHRIVAELKGRGVAILMVSSELPEVLGVSDRIVVMHEGRAVGQLPRGASESDVMDLAFGRIEAAS